MELATREYASQKGRIIKAAQNGRLRYNITLNGRSGNSIIAKGCWLVEAPQHDQVNGTTELSFGTLSMQFVLAS